MKKLLAMLCAGLLLVGCSNQDNPSSDVNDEPNQDGKVINVYVRDASSGTRAAFEEAIKLEELSSNVIEVTSNGDMATKVGSNDFGIGYVSLTTDFEANNLKALMFNGVAPSVETVLDNSYTMSRPFAYVTRAKGNFESDEKEQLVNAFIDYLQNSTEGMLVVESTGGIVNLSKGVAWAELKKNHPIVDQDNSAITLNTAGSTSVSKTLEASLASFQPMAGNFQFATNQSGSSDAFKRVLGSEKDGANAADIGFASRPFKQEETVKDGMLSGTYCMDAVVAVVHSTNELDDITTENLKAVYEGKITSFEEVK